MMPRSTLRTVVSSPCLHGLVLDPCDIDASSVVADFDVHPAAFKAPMGATPNRTILVADPSAFWRNLMRSALNMAGYTVLEASSFEEVQQNLDGQAVALIVAALDLPHNGSAGLIPLLRSRPEWSRIPVLAVAESPDHARSFDFRGAGFQDCQPKFDTVAELESIARLMSPSFLPNLHFEHVGEVR